MYPVIAIPNTAMAVPSSIACLVLAFCVGLLLSYRAAVGVEGLDPRATRVALLTAAVAALVGGRLHFILANAHQFGAHPWTLWLFPSLHAPGAVAGVLLGFAVSAHRVSMRRLADAIAPAAGIGVAIARVGCFLQGCCFGELCPYPWGVRFPRTHLSYLLQVEHGVLSAGANAPLPVHPLQLYFAVTGLLIAAVLYRVRRHKRYDGQLALLFFVSLFASSAFWEPLRAETSDRVYIGSLPELLWVTAIMTILSAAVLAAAELWVRGAGRSPIRSRARRWRCESATPKAAVEPMSSRLQAPRGNAAIAPPHGQRQERHALAGGAVGNMVGCAADGQQRNRHQRGGGRPHGFPPVRSDGGALRPRAPLPRCARPRVLRMRPLVPQVDPTGERYCPSTHGGHIVPSRVR